MMERREFLMTKAKREGLTDAEKEELQRIFVAMGVRDANMLMSQDPLTDTIQ